MVSHQTYRQRLVIILLLFSLVSSNIFHFSILAYAPSVGQCTAGRCGNYSSCSPVNPTCVCFTLSTGGGICGAGFIPCVNMTRCNNNTLTCNDSQSVCTVNTCCGYPVCLALSLTGNSYCPTNYTNGSTLATGTTSMSKLKVFNNLLVL